MHARSEISVGGDERIRMVESAIVSGDEKKVADLYLELIS
jgi:hypothetical protein